MVLILTEIDLTKKVVKPQLYLCKPNGQTVAILNEAYQITQNIKLGSVNELEFTLSVNLEINHQFQRNPHIDIIRERYLIKVKKGLSHELYIIDKITDISDDSQDIKQVHCYSLQYELTDKLIRSYDVVSYNAQQVLNDALSQTLWSIEYIEPEFLSTYRSFSVSSKTVLEFLNEIATTFSGLLIYNTLQRTMSLYNPENIGRNKGLRFSYGNLVKAIEQTINTDNFATRLKVYGQDNLTIQEVNPTNEIFIENFSNFMTTDFMSESLIDAIVTYTALIEANKDNYATLLSQLTVQQELLTTKSNELTDLKIELLIIEDSLSIAKETNQSTIEELTIQRDTKQAEVDAKQSEIDAVNLEITNITNQMIVVRDLLSIENNFTSEQIIERNQFIIEKELTNSNYTSSLDLYNFALEEFDKICKPELSIKIEIANLLEILEQQHNWDKLNLADICTVYYPRLNISIQAKIIEIDYDYEEGSVVLTIANVTQILTDQQKFLQNLYNTISTSTSMDMSKYKYQNAYTKATEIEEIINNTWNAVTRSIVAGINESVKIDSKGITVVSPDDPMGVVRINHANIAVSADGGNTYKNALTKSGLVAERVFGLLGEFCTLRADQIILGDSGETIQDSLISSAESWNSTSSQLTDFVTNTYPTDISSIQSQIDGKADTFYQTTMPHPEYVNVPNNSDYNKFVSDLWYDSTITIKKTYIYTKTVNGSNFDYKWSQQEIPKDIFDTIDGKKTIYTLKPTSYQKDDLWILENDIVHSLYLQGEILTSNSNNTSYLESDWILKVRYTDDTVANQAWGKFSGLNNTLPSGNVEFNFATSNSKGGNASNTDNVGTQSASTVQSATINFDGRNDRKDTTPANPTIANDGTSIDHTINTDGSANISFEWSFTGTGDAYDIDGFIVYVYQSTSSSAYVFGATSANEQLYYVTPEKRAFILHGIPSNKYYTFGIKAYRIVDQDINASGVLVSSIIKSAYEGENPYQPSSTVAFGGDVTGTIDGVSASTVKDQAGNSIQSGVNYNKCSIDQNGVQVKNGTETEVVKMGEFATGLYGIKATHADGSYTQLSQNGLQRLVAGETIPMQYETHIVSATTVGISNSAWISTSDPQYAIDVALWDEGITLSLPPRFHGKNFQCFLTMKSLEIPIANEGGTVRMVFKAPALNIDRVNGTVNVVGYAYDNAFGLYMYQGIDFNLIVTL